MKRPAWTHRTVTLAPPRVRARNVPTFSSRSYRARIPDALGRRSRPLPVAAVVLTVLGLVAIVGYGARRGPQTTVLVAAADLPVGTVLTGADVHSVSLSGNPEVLGSLLPIATQVTVIGRRLTEAVTVDEPFTEGDLQPAGISPSEFTLTVPDQHALGGDVAVGDRVTVLATFTTANGGSTTRSLARGLLVVAVGALPSLGDPSQDTIPVTVALPKEAVASELALANSVAKLDLLLDPAGRSAAGAIPVADAPGSAT